MDTMPLLWQSLPDEAVLIMTNQNKALLLTADKDFGELVFRQ
jgi:predicted nuclease of predicted toxin-antitoxin system